MRDDEPAITDMAGFRDVEPGRRQAAIEAAVFGAGAMWLWDERSSLRALGVFIENASTGAR